jgi:hypothetical protein
MLKAEHAAGWLGSPGREHDTAQACSIILLRTMRELITLFLLVD